MIQAKVSYRGKQKQSATRQTERGLRGRLLEQADERTLRDVLALEFPDVNVKTVRVHRTRDDKYVVEINDELILRFPLNKTQVAVLRRERRLQNALRDHLSLTIPRSTITGRQFVCDGYWKIPGVYLRKEWYRAMPYRQQLKVAAGLARFCYELQQALSVGRAKKLGLVGPRVPMSAARLRERLPPLVEDRAQLPLVATVLDLYEEVEQSPYVPAVIHADLHGWNITCDSADGTPTGVFDFEDICIGDPHLNFRYLYAWEPGLLEMTLAEYARLSGCALSMQRCLIYNAVTDFSDLVWRIEHGEPLATGPITKRLADVERRLAAWDMV